MRRKLKVLLLFDSPYETPRGYDFKEEFKHPDWKTEMDVYKALLDNGYDVVLLGISGNILLLLEETKESKPDIVFNMAEVFKDKSRLEKNIAWFLEMLEVPYTGASPSNFLVCSNKALSKKILSYHKIKIPHFYTFYREHKVWLPKKLKTPLIVKPLDEEASRGISQASIVDTEDALVERVRFIHEKMSSDAIVEEYIDGRELYVSLIGRKRISVFPPIEMKFGDMPDDEPKIATYRAKWDKEYRRKWGIRNEFTGRLSDSMIDEVSDVCKRAYKALDIECYARFDVRVDPSNQVYVLEANANPCIAKDEDFGQSAEKGGLSYPRLINKIIRLGFGRK
ncbi:MAG: ATP-grasp domain-containing protein [Candidatus Omnitrophota bacterium]